MPRWDALLSHLVGKGWPQARIRDAGLAVLKEDGSGQYDRFRDRIIFPVRNLRGKVIAFGGRIIPRPAEAGGTRSSDNQPKYLNSPETPLFQKGHHLFALDRAIGAVKSAEGLIIVEGYLDALSAHEAGIGNVAATLGTALTSEHLHLIRRFTRNAVLLFDSDEAGIRAALRSVELFLGSNLKASVVMLPEGEDPDSLIRQRGAEAFKAELSKQTGLLDFAIQCLVGRSAKATIQEKLKVVESVLPLLALISNPVERSHYLRQVADALHVHERDLGQELSRHIKTGRKRKSPPQPPQGEVISYPSEERFLIKLLLQGKIAVHQVQSELSSEDFMDPRVSRIYEILVQGSGAEGMSESRLVELLRQTQDQLELSELISAWSLEELECDDYEKTVQDCLSRIKTKRMERELQALEERIRLKERESDREAVKTLQEGVLTLKKKILNCRQGEGIF